MVARDPEKRAAYLLGNSLLMYRGFGEELHTNRSRSLLASFAATVLMAGITACGPLDDTPAPTSASTPYAIPTQADVAPTASALPTTAGTLSEVEGVLEVVGSLPRLRFFLLTHDGTRIEVLPWLPTEVMHPPAGQTAPPTMADWVGQRVKLRGSWVQSESGLVFQVISAERGQP